MQVRVDDAAQSIGAEGAMEQRNCLVGVGPISRIYEYRTRAIVPPQQDVVGREPTTFEDGNASA
jgi:hypothetical protein